MIYSKALAREIPVRITKEVYDLKFFGLHTRYNVFDDKINVGYVDLIDTPNGVHVDYIRNNKPEQYSGFGHLADQIEVEHCLNRGLKNFEIFSDAGLNSHAKHYQRGKRFFDNAINKKVKQIIESTPIGEKFNTEFLGNIKMYMPKKMIDKIISKILKNRVLK